MKKPNINQEDKGKTAEKILQVAIKLFAKNGYHGTTVDDIVEKAKVNKRMVYHYFGDKAGLYREVHWRGWTELQKSFKKSLETFNWGQVHETKAEQALVVMAMDFLFDFAVEHMQFLRIILWDALEGGKVTRTLWKERREPLYQEISLLLMAAQQQGLIPAELKINHLIATSLGMVSFYFTFANSLHEMFPPDPMAPAALAERKSQMLISFKRLIGIHEKGVGQGP